MANYNDNIEEILDSLPKAPHGDGRLHKFIADEIADIIVYCSERDDEIDYISIFAEIGFKFTHLAKRAKNPEARITLEDYENYFRN